jgi:hypothetical protein
VKTEEERRAPLSEAGRQGPVNTGEATTCLGMDERRAGQRRGTGRQPAFVLKAAL